MSALAMIHVLKKNAGLDDETYRDLMDRETGKRSAKDLTASEKRSFIVVLNGLSGEKKPAAKSGSKYEAKLQALWIAAYNLGVVGQRSNDAMLTFLRRQTGLDHSRFLLIETDALKAIEGLKIWIRRATGNDELFRTDATLPRLYNDPRFQVCIHIWSELVKLDRLPASASTLTVYLHLETGQEWPEHIEPAQWIEVQNKLGQLLRKAKK
ncbi:regulatory protein GemA [Roseibium litorale]|uniref:Regulatory protein GemA n=1 Tax=Roseibium litorale TaxID=2803841 RepID=A0ABR9CJA0_9HYPH|nr:regulatory protein GemA [Roseibium litorale]MBD8890917.1 regulatory protein GemA [Roseibium litorale]